MGEHENFLKAFVNKLDELQTAKKAIEDQIAAIELAYETFTGTTAPTKVATPKAPRTPRVKPRYVRARTLDRQGLEKTLAFIQDRVRPTTAEPVAKHFGITDSAARQRLAKLVTLGWAERVATGKFVAKAKGVPKSKPSSVATAEA